MELFIGESRTQLDCRGIPRGSCQRCGCAAYNGGSAGKKCEDCSHPPGQHKNITLGVAPKEVEFFTPPAVMPSLDEDIELPRSRGVPPISEPLTVLDLEEEQLPEDEVCIFRGCKRRRFKDKDKTHNFCGRTHARLYREETCDSEMMCKTPGCKNGRYKRENNTYFDYCSLYCRDNQQEEGRAMLEPSQCGVCSLPDCTKFKYQDPSNGRIHEFCSRSHASQAAQSGTTTDAIAITMVTAEEHAFISGKFTAQWSSGKGKCPQVDFIFSVSNSKLKQRWKTYQGTLSSNTTEEYFHGTKLECNIATTHSLCTNQDCGVCGIVNIGFDRRCIRRNIQFQRFGHGFYLAPNSSKCHDYTQGKGGFRAMLLFQVCPGKKYQLQRDNETLTAPPQGYNSVHGKQGISLNYDELVIYNPDGALPQYIIVYQKDGDRKIAK